ncbi:MAG TPA: exopolysaccharide biosynthesis polyprenyl glycosylphosphotransferase [Nocardioides sp.]|nr:exopolysaccharide biosynthesis polyprenyl glycosylphosphotransferase [Nocardioides sp.]
MAQISVEMVPPGPASLTAPPVPRPREAQHPAPFEGSPTPTVAAGTAVHPRRHFSGTGLALDTVLAVALAVTVVALDRLSSEMAAAAVVGWVAILAASGHYRLRALDQDRTTRLRLVLGTGFKAVVVVLALSPWFQTPDSLSLAQLVVAFGLASAVPPLLGIGRHRPRLVLAGRPRDVRDAILELEVAGSHEVVAVCLTRPSKVPVDLPTYVGFGTTPQIAEQHRADALVVLPGARLAPAELRRLHWGLAGVGTELCVGTGLLDVTPTRTRVFASGGLTLVRAVSPSLRGPRRWVKEVVERVAATIALVLLSPVLLVVGLLVRLDSQGPAIYKQQRVGRDGRLFWMYKFRSMSVSAETDRTELIACNEADGVLFKIQQDPRVTRLGQRLRRWSIDEVPQLWNVVRGDMSLVGPRPALPDEVARYDVDPRRRLVVKPGCTGLWQVSGRSDLSWAESVRLDVRYVDNWSLGLDLSILLRTASAVLGRRGAY